MKKAISIIIIIVLLPILLISGIILVNSIIRPDEVPSFMGWKPFIVLSGSMETEIYPGDLAMTKDVGTDNLKEGDVIAFRHGDVVITHRIVKILEENGETKYVTKGDNNNTEDVGYVTPGDVEGVYQFKISKLGNLAMFMQTPTGMIACLSIPLLLLVIVHMKESAEDRQYLKEKASKQRQMEQEIEELKRKNEELEKEKLNK
ncbi:MAG: signal peptidase I [Clostridia bacterium]|nr:signal peptidase I [Clostridia bacterium]